MAKRIFFTVFILPFLVFGQNQEIATFVSYNTLNYRNETSFCTNSNNNPIAKEGYMKTIFGYLDPDLVMCQEIGANANNAIKILDRCLNVDGETKYAMAPFTATSGSSLANALYYNTDMFALKGADKITHELDGGTIIRHIDVFYLYYKDVNLPQNSDTTFLTVFVAHLKAGSSSSDASQRGQATESVMQYINDKGITGNFIIAGDFNSYTSSESGIQNLVNPSNAQVKFLDPVNQMGNWNNNSSFAAVHTQSTRYSGNGCASGGGLDDRFDWIMISEAIKDNTHRIEYVKNSYKALANDGMHFNQSINNPTNTSVPANVLDAIYNSSDHLPIVMDVIITEASTNSVIHLFKPNFSLTLPNPTHGEITGKISGIAGSYSISVYATDGRVVKHILIHGNGDMSFRAPVPSKGVYFVEIQLKGGERLVKKVVVN